VSARSSKRDVFLLVSGDVEEADLLTNGQLVEQTLRGILSLIGMNAISAPLVFQAKNNPGLEGYIPIDASNITISTYLDPPRIVACVHSCNAFDKGAAVRYLKAQFRCGEIRFRWITEQELEAADA